jgi:hypothetical protein
VAGSNPPLERSLDHVLENLALELPATEQRENAPDDVFDGTGDASVQFRGASRFVPAAGTSRGMVGLQRISVTQRGNRLAQFILLRRNVLRALLLQPFLELFLGSRKKLARPTRRGSSLFPKCRRKLLAFL